MVLVQKWPFFQFFFRHYRPEKCLLRNSRTKKCLSKLQKQEVQKVEKLTFFLKGLTRGFGPKMAIFQSFILGNIGQENVFYNILERKSAFLSYKKQLKIRKIDIFPKWLTHGMGQKWPFFKPFFF